MWSADCASDTSSFLASYVGIVRICTRTARREHFSVELLKDPKTYYCLSFPVLNSKMLRGSTHDRWVFASWASRCRRLTTLYTFTDRNSVNTNFPQCLYYWGFWPFGRLAYYKLQTIIVLVELLFTWDCDVVLPFVLIGEGSFPTKSKSTQIY